MSIAKPAALPATRAMRHADAVRPGRRQGELRHAQERLRRTAQRLRESEELFRRTFDQAAVGMVQVGLDGRYLRVNDRFCEIVGYRREELLARRFVDITHPDDARVGLVDGKIPISQNSEVVRLEKRYLHRQGQVVWVSVTTALIHTKERIYAQGLIEDITGRKEAERVLRESEARKVAVLDSSHEGIITFDREGRIVEFNAVAERMFGRSRAEVTGCVPDMLMPAIELVHFQRNVADLVAARGSRHAGPFEASGLRADGREFPLEIAVAQVDLEGPPLFTCSLRDITERLSAQEALRESEARAQSIVDHMLGGAIMADEAYVIRSANAAAARMFGYLEDDLVGRHLSSILAEFGDGDGDGGSEGVLQLGDIEPHVMGGISEWIGRRRDGSVFPFELSLCHFQSGGHRYVAGNLRDLTELHEVERLREELISTVNHELRTPITSIRGSLALLASGVLGAMPSEAAEVIAIADRNSLRLLTLINDMLDLERLERGQMEMESEPVAVATLMERSLEVVMALADAEGIAIELHPTADSMIGDLERLVQVLVNLLSNAVKFSPRGSAVSVCAVAVQGTIEVRVKDRGRGVAAAHRELIFERFKQLEASDARHKAGTGLGLAISKSIVKQLGGQIGMESGEGGGSVFWFRLPAASATSRLEPLGAAAGSGERA